MSLDAELELDAGALVEPLAAPLEGWLESLEEELLLELGAGELGVLLIEPLALVEPPAAESFFVASLDEVELEEDAGGVAGFTVTEPDVELEPDGAVDGVVEPADDDEVEPAGGVVRVTARSPSRSQPAINPAPSARETATAKAESLICGPPWLGYQGMRARIGPMPLRS